MEVMDVNVVDCVDLNCCLRYYSCRSLERSLVNNVFVETDKNNNYHVSQLVNCPKKKTLNTLHVFNSFFLHSNLADISVIYFILTM